MVLVALQPMKAMDYARATTYMQLCNDDYCSIPEFTGRGDPHGKARAALIRAHGRRPGSGREIAEWCRIAKVLHDLKTARIGHFGHVLEEMLDMQTDQTAMTAAFGCHIVQTEADDLMRHFRRVTDPKSKDEGRVLEFFETPDPKSRAHDQKVNR